MSKGQFSQWDQHSVSLCSWPSEDISTLSPVKERFSS